MTKSKSSHVPVAVSTLTFDEAGKEHSALAARLTELDAAYYQADAPLVSDADYDALRRRLLDIEANFPETSTPQSPSRRTLLRACLRNDCS